MVLCISLLIILSSPFISNARILDKFEVSPVPESKFEKNKLYILTADDYNKPCLGQCRFIFIDRYKKNISKEGAINRKSDTDFMKNFSWGSEEKVNVRFWFINKAKLKKKKNGVQYVIVYRYENLDIDGKFERIIKQSKNPRDDIFFIIDNEIQSGKQFLLIKY